MQLALLDRARAPRSRYVMVSPYHYLPNGIKLLTVLDAIQPRDLRSVASSAAKSAASPSKSRITTIKHQNTPPPGGLKASLWDLRAPTRVSATSARAPTVATCVSATPSRVSVAPRRPARDDMFVELWNGLFENLDSHILQKGMDKEQLHFEKCLRMQSLGMKMALEADMRMKEVLLLGLSHVKRGFY